MKVLETNSTFKCGSETSKTMPRRPAVAIFLGKIKNYAKIQDKKLLAKMWAWFDDFCG